MVIVRIMGGLGNQLFQYATGRRLAEVRGVPLKLDISFFDTQELRAFSLANYNIQGEIASSTDISRLTGAGLRGLRGRWLRFRNRNFPWRIRSHVKQRFYRFDPDILNLADDVYLDGYWGNENNFKDIRDILLSELTQRESLCSASQSVADKIAEVESVSLHIRRGDYVTDEAANSYFGTCTLEYYYSAETKLIELGITPHFFVFSDDIAWAKENLKLNHPVEFVCHNGTDKDYEDLTLMSRCKHHITANSTFSWWGAWLCTNSRKIVITPKKWYGSVREDGPFNNNIPDEWIKL